MLNKLITLILLGFAGLTHAEYGLNMTKGVTSVSRNIYDLHMLVFWICVVIGVIVFGLMIYSMLNHRKSRGAVAANFHESTSVEIAWTLIPLAILIAVAFPATKALIDLEDGSKSDMSIKITGYQWKWQYEYMGDNVSFFSNLAKASKDQISDAIQDNSSARNQNKNYLLEVDNNLVVPVGKKIRLLMTSNDVIHSWWVPETGVKQDAIPGFINDAWMTIDKPGIYRGQCAELCGKDHGFMPIVVEAKTVEDYDIWLSEKKQQIAAAAEESNQVWNKEELMARGKEVYNTSCMACHGVTGAGIPGAFPAITNSPIALGAIAGHLDIVMNGKAGTAMAAYKKQLNDVDLAAVITFERNALGNSSGDVVQPSQVKSAR